MRRTFWNIFGAFVGGLLVMAGLYQMEIIFICIAEDRYFDLPFYIIKHPDAPVGSDTYWRWMSLWRDVFYAWIILGTFIFGLSMYKPIEYTFKTLKRKMEK